MRQNDVIPEATQTAKKQLAAGDISGAERLLSQQLQRTPQDRETHYYYCVCLRYLTRLSDAQGELETLLSRFPRFARGYQELGYTFKALNDQDKALSSFRTAVTLNDALLGSWRALVELTSVTYRPTIYEEAVTQTQNLEGLPKALLQVRDWINEGRLAQAEQLCRQFLLRHPRQVEGMRLLAYIGVQTEVLDDAEVLLENAVQFEPDNDLARFDYMGVLYKRQKYAASFAQAEKLIEKAPENVRHQTAYANQCVAIGRFDEAIAIYDQVIPKVPDPAVVHLLKAHALKTIDQSEQAIASYRAAYENKPGFGDAFWSLANLKTYRFTTLEVDAMMTSVAEPNLSPVDHVHLNFALGKTL